MRNTTMLVILLLLTLPAVAQSSRPESCKGIDQIEKTASYAGFENKLSEQAVFDMWQRLMLCWADAQGRQEELARQAARVLVWVSHAEIDKLHERIGKLTAERDALRAEARRSVGRYQVYHDGKLVWRLDTATGKSCLMNPSAAMFEDYGGVQATCAFWDASPEQQAEMLRQRSKP